MAVGLVRRRLGLERWRLGLERWRLGLVRPVRDHAIVPSHCDDRSEWNGNDCMITHPAWLAL